MGTVSIPATMTLPNDQDATGRTLGLEEIEAAKAVLESGILTSTKGNAVRGFEKAFAQRLGVEFAHACASGSAANHVAIAALDMEPGEEVITSPITDMGALTPIVYQGGIPVFCDVDPVTLNPTAETIAARISERTRAIVVTHLFGQPCNMGPIMALAEKHGIPVLEDCAQSFLASDQGKYVGTFGKINSFSLQQGKHITTGEGGIITTNDPAVARKAYLFINKAWGYGDTNPDHYFLALNYRMSELLGAVALAQMGKLDYSVNQRAVMAERLTCQLRGLKGIGLPETRPGQVHVYWKYGVTVDGDVVEGGAVAMAKLLKERGIASAPRYIQKPAFACQVFRDQRTFGNSRFPFTLARPEAVNYDKSLFPGVYKGLEQILVLPWNERYTEEHADFIAGAFLDAYEKLSGGRA